MSFIAIVPSAVEGEVILTGAVSNGTPFCVKVSPESGSVIYASEFLTEEVKLEIMRMVREQFGSGEEMMETDQVIRNEPVEQNLWADRVALFLTAAETIGWDKVKSYDKDGNSIEFTLTDGKLREHTIQFYFDNGQNLRCKVNLPDTFLTETKIRSITQTYELFGCVVDEYQDFWDVMAELDQRAHILEPSMPGFSDIERSIFLEPHVSVTVTVTPTMPRNYPQLVLVGPEPKILLYQQRIDGAVSTWDSEHSLADNLERIFYKFQNPVTFTQKSIQNEQPRSGLDENEKIKCEICFDADEEPDETCKRCKRVYHQECLIQAQKRQMVKRATYGTVPFKCPQCGNAMTVKIR